MECPKCGVANKEELERCRMCGAELRPRKRSRVPSTECPFCKATNEFDAVFCVNCNKLLGMPTEKAIEAVAEKTKKEKYHDRTYADYPSSAMRTARVGTAGIIMMMVALFAIIDVVLTLGVGYSVTQMEDYDQLVRESPEVKSFVPNLVVCESVRIVFACIAFVGAIAAIQRLNFGLAIMGGVFGILAIGSSIMALVWGVWLLITGVLFSAAIFAVILVAISRREFMLA